MVAGKLSIHSVVSALHTRTSSWTKKTDKMNDIEEVVWKRLHVDDAGLATMMHRCKKGGLSVKRKDLKQGLELCRTCQ